MYLFIGTFNLGCLPVPLFNQKKRNRQPLTSNPLKNDPGISTASDSYDFPPLPTGKKIR